MTKNILIALSVAMFGSAAFAQTDYSQEIAPEQIYEQENGAIAPLDLEALAHQEEVSDYTSGKQIIGGIIGGIIGAIEADRWDRDNGRDRPGRPGRPGGGHDRMVTCFAKNARGEMFRATAYRAREAQNSALRKCQSYSRSCRTAGCR